MTVNLRTIKDIRFYFARELGSLYDEKETSSLAKIIIKTTTGASGLHQLNNPGFEISKEQALEIIRICEELKTGKPYQYILGETQFYNCIIRVNPSVLIPRPETEELTELIIRENKNYSGGIIDFGTGSGCIAIALAANLQESSVTGFDISADALQLAEINAGLNNLTVAFRKNDILNFSYDSITEKPGIIVSNPPYVRNSEKKLMNKNVLDFEPYDALFVDDSDPLQFYRAILDIADKILMKGGKIYFEINEAMGNPMADLLISQGYSGVTVIKDLNNKDRFIKGALND